MTNGTDSLRPSAKLSATLLAITSTISPIGKFAPGTFLIIRESYAAIDLEESYSSLFEMLWYSQIPCFDILNIISEHFSIAKTLSPSSTGPK